MKKTKMKMDTDKIVSKIVDLTTKIGKRNKIMLQTIGNIDALTSCPGKRLPSQALNDIHKMIVDMFAAAI